MMVKKQSPCMSHTHISNMNKVTRYIYIPLVLCKHLIFYPEFQWKLETV